MNDDEIRAAIYQGIREEIQEGINDYVDQKEEIKKTRISVLIIFLILIILYYPL